MANRDCITFSWGGDDYAAIEYNDANLSIRRVHFSLSAGRTIRILIWDVLDGGVVGDPATALFDETLVGPLNDNRNIPGNYRLIERTDAGGTYVDVPDNIFYRVVEQFIGG